MTTAAAEPPAAAATGSTSPPPAADPHLDRLRKLLRIETSEVEQSLRKRGRQPTALQCLQQEVRLGAVDCAHHLGQRGQTQEDCGRLLHVSPRTLRYWEQLSRTQMISLVPVGRPLERSPLPVRQAILDYLRVTGPGIGVPTLEEQFPDVCRAELADLLRRYRAVWQLRHTESPRVLHWQTPGHIWAADFTEPSHYGALGLPPIDGRYPYVLAVRDLASGFMLAWQPIADLSAEVARAELARLFALWGAPLVLKVDNGSAFRAEAFQEILAVWGVLPLYSPPSSPGYNGSIEAAIGSLKKRTDEAARQQGDGDHWTGADLESAQSSANASHPRRLNGRTPSAVWRSRQPIESLERVVFELTVQRQRMQAREELGIDQEAVLEHWRASAVDRKAVERALVEHGHVLFTRRRIPLKIRGRKAATDG